MRIYNRDGVISTQQEVSDTEMLTVKVEEVKVTVITKKSFSGQVLEFKGALCSFREYNLIRSFICKQTK